MWALKHSSLPPVLLCKYSLFLLLLVHSTSSLDAQPVVALPPCTSSECYVSPAASADFEAGTPTDLIVVFKVSPFTAF